MAVDREYALPDEFASGLQRLEKHVRSLLLIRGTGLVLMILAAGLCAVFVLDLAFGLASFSRLILLVAIGGLMAATVIWNWVRPSCRRLGSAELAAMVEDAHPEFGERLTSAIELNDPNVPSEHRGSALMCEQLTRQAAASAATIDLTTAVPPSNALRYFTFGAVCLVVLVAPFLFAPQWYGLLWSRLLAPWGNFDSAGNLIFDVENGNRVVARGDDVTIRVQPRWRLGGGELPGPVWLTRVGTDGEHDARRLEVDSETGALVATVPPLFSGFDYRIDCGRVHSRQYRIDVADAPEALAFALEVEPPAYTGRAAERIDGALGETLVFENSTLRFRLGFNQPVASAQLGDGRAMVIAEDGLSGTLETIATTGGPLKVKLANEYGLENRNEPERSIRIVRDEAPRLSLSGSDEPTSVRPGESHRVLVQAADDIAVEKVELHFQVLNGESGVMAVDSARLGKSLVNHEFELNPVSMKLASGQALTYRVRAVDGRPVPGPNEVWSNRRVLSVNSDAPPAGAADVAKRQQDLKQQLSEIRSELLKHREQVAQLHNESVTASETKADFNADTKLRELPREEQAVAQKLEELADDLGNQPLFENLADPTRNVARNELAEASHKLANASGTPLPEQSKALKDGVDRLIAADEKLGEIERKFDQLAGLERDLLELNRLAREAEKLADNAQEIHDERKKESENRAASNENQKDGENNNDSEKKNEAEQSAKEQKLSNDEEQLRKEQQALAEELKNLLDRQPELANSARQKQIDRLAELGKQANELAKPQQMMADELREQPPTQRPGEQQPGTQPAEQQPKGSPQEKSESKPESSKEVKDQGQQPNEQQPGDRQADQQPNAKPDEKTEPNAEPSKEEKAEGQQPGGQQPGDQQTNQEPKQDTQNKTASNSEPLKDAKPQQPKSDVAQPNNSQPKGDSQESGDDEQVAEQLQRQQQQVAREAAKMAIQAAGENGAQSAATQKAIEAMRQANEASRSLLAGRLEEAAAQAQAAAKQAYEAAESLEGEGQKSGENRSGKGTDPLARQARDVAASQQQAAKRIEEAAKSPTMRAGAQIAGERQLSEATRRLTEELESVAARLSAEPLTAPESAAAANGAQNSTRQADKAMQQTGGYLRKGETTPAAETADLAAKALNDAAARAAAGVPAEQGERSPVPADIADRVADAAQKLNQAGRQLSKRGSEKQSEEKSNEQGEDSQSAQQGNSPDSDEGKGNKGSSSQGDLAQSSEQMRRAAEALKQAAKDMQMPRASEAGRGSSSAQTSQSGDGSGTQETLDPKELDAQLSRTSKRQWGQLPGTLKTEILQADGRNPNSNYAKLIRLYFREIADEKKSASTPPTKANPAQRSSP